MRPYTPPPWGLNDRHIAGINPRTGKLRPIATATWHRGTHVGEARANARLMRAAPELLEALQRLHVEASRMPDYQGSELAATIDALIESAGGNE